MGDGDGLGIGGGEDLQAAGQASCVFDGTGDDGDGRDDFGTDVPSEVGRVVHVFQHEAVHASLAVDCGLF